MEDATRDGTSRVDAVQGADDVGRVVISRFASRGQIKVGVEVGLTDSRADNGQTVGCRDRAQGNEDDKPQVVLIDNDLI